ncbi:squalene/phytoene synthase family protein [Tropicimonas marinistellae]|uniref:squalene/phytoene synthase family protein n=1 Tax=Tropicimonas marinistellae TaxID=1739787 RepID=UPI0008378C02|nr:squalene/phytoene synthase family protein [Tropicimonas marinistellae]
MSLDACAEIVERGDPDRFLAAIAAPLSARACLLPLYAFNVDVARLPWVSPEPMICEMRLQWWRDTLEQIGRGEIPSTHEIAIPLAETIRRHGISIDVLDAMVLARRWDIYHDPFEDTPALHSYIDATAAGLTWVSAQALGATAEAEGAVRDAGWAAGLASYLRAIPDLEARGRRPLVDGRADAISDLARLGLTRLRSARRAGVPSAAIPALRAGWRTETTLKRAVQTPQRVAAGTLAESEFSRRAGLMRRAFLGTW